ncbi:hypothetical protein GW17_00004373 [Ensete ventricosum]|nr:hypothetical protein GW17_00004373 [Ensete ventricosum]
MILSSVLVGSCLCVLDSIRSTIAVLAGGDDLCPLFSGSSRFLSLGLNVDVYCPPCKRARVIAPLGFSFRGREEVAAEKQQPRSIDTLPDECLFEILSRLPGEKERSSCACVSKRWLMLLISIRSSELAAGMKTTDESVKKPMPDLSNGVCAEKERENNGYLTRRLDAEEATDMRLASIAFGSCSRGGLGRLFIRGSNSTRVSDVGLSAIAHGCPSLRVLSLWKVPLITDAGLSEIADGCPLLEKIDLCECPQISDKGLIAVAQKCPNLTSLTIESCSSVRNEGLQAIGRCCSNLKSVAVKDCMHVGDQGIASLVSLASSSLQRIKLQTLNISDIVLAVIGHYGKNVIDLALIDLQKVNEKGFWVMGNILGLQRLRSIAITSCGGLTDLGLQAIAKGSPSLKQLCICKSDCLSDAGLRAFAGTARALENLRLEDCNRLTLIGIIGATDASLIPLIGNSKAGLVEVNLSGCVNVTDALVAMLVKSHGGTLKVFNLDGCKKITNRSLLEIADGCSVLDNLDLSSCSVSDYGVAILASARHLNLSILSLASCSKVTEKSLPFLGNMGSSMVGLNLQHCSLISTHGIGLLEEKMWWCDILS